MQRYPPFETGTGLPHVRYFTPISIPIFDKRGAVAWILHRVEEVTEYVTARTVQVPSETHTAAAALYARTRELVRRNRELALQASRDRTVSQILQEAMLTELPDPHDLHLVARYVADTDTDQVGGDWYDAAVLPAGATMVAVGDVIGHDISAAASMGQLRGLLRAVAWDREEPPSMVLARVERGMSGLHVDTSPQRYWATSSCPVPTAFASCAGPTRATRHPSWYPGKERWKSWRLAMTSRSARVRVAPQRPRSPANPWVDPDPLHRRSCRTTRPAAR